MRFCKKKSAESFYTDGYNLIVLDSSLIFPGLTTKVATLLSSKFLDVYLAWNNDKKEVHSIYTKNLDDRKLSGLQYIAGYVLQKLNQKNRNLKNYDSSESQQALSILKATKSSNNPNAKLVNALNRGGLWVISNGAVKLFTLFEKYFCVQSAGKDLHKIDINMIIKSLLSYCCVQEFYHNILSSVQLKVNETIADDMFYSIVKTYIQVRAFSFTRDIVHKDRIKNRKIKATKSLRNEIKKSSDM